MKKDFGVISLFLQIPVAAFPYLSVAAILLIFFDKNENANETVGNFLYAGIPIAFVFCLFCAIFATILTALGNGTAIRVARAVMIVKIVQIPAYVTIFVFGFLLSAVAFVFAIPLVLFLWLLDCAAILQTGILGIGSVRAARRTAQLTAAEAVLCGVLQFLFVVDVFATVYLYLRTRLTPVKKE